LSFNADFCQLTPQIAEPTLAPNSTLPNLGLKSLNSLD